MCLKKEEADSCSMNQPHCCVCVVCVLCLLFCFMVTSYRGNIKTTLIEVKEITNNVKESIKPH